MFYFLLIVAVFQLFLLTDLGFSRGHIDLMDSQKQRQLEESLC